VLIDWVIPQSEYLLKEIICLAPKGVVIHPIGDVLATVLDQSGGLLRNTKVDVHIVDECDRIQRNLYPLAKTKSLKVSLTSFLAS
jgi:hypothetical protein